MKYLKLFESLNKSEIDRICREYNISNYIINPDGSIDANKVILYLSGLTKLPLKFNKVNGYFDCSSDNLITLEGSPVEVNGDFWCHNNKLKSFEFVPKIIRGSFNCSYNNVKTFEYFPNFVKNIFDCGYNPIFEVWILFRDTTKIELLNDFDIFRNEDTDDPVIIMDRLNDFLLTIGKDTVEYVHDYKNI